MNDPYRAAPSASAATPHPRRRAWIAAVLACAGAVPMDAAALPAPSTNVFCSVEGNTFMHPTHCEFGAFPGVPSSAIADIAPSIPLAIASASTPTTSVLGAGASATILYWFQVVGPTVGELVPILMETSLVTQATAESKALARLIVNTTSGTFEGFEACTDDSCDAASFSETISLSVLSGSTQDSVTLYAEAQARLNRFANEEAIATADPYFYVDPAFPDAHLYSIVVSPGVGNTPPVPQPASAYLMAAGLLALAARMLSGQAGSRTPEGPRDA
jgi:hypothetical protein